MTASGLPQGLEKCLSALLQDNSLTSWRIFAGDGGDHTVTIRLHARETAHGEQHTGGWYKKGHARMNRDRQRWIQHQNKTLNDFYLDSFYASIMLHFITFLFFQQMNLNIFNIGLGELSNDLMSGKYCYLSIQ